MAKKIPTINKNYIRRLQLEDNPEEVLRLIKDFLVETVSTSQTGTQHAIASALEDLRSIREGIATNQIQAGDYSKKLVDMVNNQINTMDIRQDGRKAQEGISKRIGSAIKSAVSNSLPSPGRFIDAVYNENPLIGYLPKFIKDTVVQTKARSELVNSEIRNAKKERETIEQEYANALIEERELGSTTDGKSRVSDLYLPILERMDKNIELMMKEWVTLPEDIGKEFDDSMVQLSRDMDKRSEEEMQAAERSRRLELAKQPQAGQSLGLMSAGNQNSDIKGGGLNIFGGMKGMTEMLNKTFIRPLKYIIGGLIAIILNPFKRITKLLRLAFTGLTKGAKIIGKVLAGFGRISWTTITKGFTMLSRGLGKIGKFFSSGFSRAFTATMNGLGKIGTGLASFTKVIKIPGIDKIANLGKLAKGGGLLKLFGRANPIIAAAFAVYDIVDGFSNASELTGIPEEDLSFFGKINAGISNFVTNLVGLVNDVSNLFGFGDLIDTDDIYRTIFNMGTSIENFFVDLYNGTIGRLPGFEKMEYSQYMSDKNAPSDTGGIAGLAALAIKSIPPITNGEFVGILEETRDAIKDYFLNNSNANNANNEKNNSTNASNIINHNVDDVSRYSSSTAVSNIENRTALEPVPKEIHIVNYEKPQTTTSQKVIQTEEITRQIERVNGQNRQKELENKANNTIINAPNNNVTNIHSSTTNINTSNTDSTFRRTLNR